MQSSPRDRDVHDRGEHPKSTTGLSDRFTILADDRTLAETTVALEEHGFGVDVVDSLDAARETVLARLPPGASVMTNTSLTLEESGLAAAIRNRAGYQPWQTGRSKCSAAPAMWQRVPQDLVLR